jgi:hypothetical protein
VSVNRKDGGPAFPMVVEEEGCITQFHRGMTLRDWFAGQALAGLVTLEADCGTKGIAFDAYAYADAMLAVREVGDD